MSTLLFIIVASSSAVNFYEPNNTQWVAVRSIMTKIAVDSPWQLAPLSPSAQRGQICPDSPLDSMVQCDAAGNVILFSAFDRNFKGDLSKTNWSALTELTYLNLANNQISGTIPPSFLAMTSLKNLYLQRNNITGPLNSRIGNVTHCIVIGFPPELDGNCFDEQLDGTTPCGGTPENVSTSCPKRDYVVGKTDETKSPTDSPILSQSTKTKPATLLTKSTAMAQLTSFVEDSRTKTIDSDSIGWIMAFVVFGVLVSIFIIACVVSLIWYFRKQKKDEIEMQSVQDYIDDVAFEEQHQQPSSSSDGSFSVESVPNCQQIYTPRKKENIYDFVHPFHEYANAPPMTQNIYGNGPPERHDYEQPSSLLAQ